MMILEAKVSGEASKGFKILLNKKMECRTDVIAFA